ncbi:hypothetical protein MUS1_13220 [Marinomonas ushuaiensis DSM 15871]|uniref:LicD/FKTN/FKRP nucleotidyltransferase domain-containing protein n=2 Tax=Marinomonas TaxID=28253 RepID=X7E4H5_9GAMM|nr:hypothetical protein MUS1_13220 [Marinomonas ushuaiensis DSM 15871]
MKGKTFRIKKNRENALMVLSAVVNALDEFNIKYYLDFGSLIGAVREKGLILWDDDIDISLYDESDYEKIPMVLNYIKKKNKLRVYLKTFLYSLESSAKKHNKIPNLNISFTDINNFHIAKVRNNNFFIFGRGKTCLDIFFKYEKNEKLYWMAYGEENSVPKKYLESDLIEINFCGIKCKIPEKYDEYLTYKYGDWKTPKENWSHECDDFSVEKAKV